MILKITNIVKSNLEQDQSLSVTVDKCLNNFPENQAVEQPIFSSTLIESISPIDSKLQETDQNSSMNSQNKIGSLYLELDAQPIDHSLFDLNFQIAST